MYVVAGSSHGCKSKVWRRGTNVALIPPWVCRAPKKAVVRSGTRYGRFEFPPGRASLVGPRLWRVRFCFRVFRWFLHSRGCCGGFVCSCFFGLRCRLRRSRGRIGGFVCSRLFVLCVLVLVARPLQGFHVVPVCSGGAGVSRGPLRRLRGFFVSFGVGVGGEKSGGVKSAAAKEAEAKKAAAKKAAAKKAAAKKAGGGKSTFRPTLESEGRHRPAIHAVGISRRSRHQRRATRCAFHFAICNFLHRAENHGNSPILRSVSAEGYACKGAGEGEAERGRRRGKGGGVVWMPLPVVLHRMGT